MLLPGTIKYESAVNFVVLPTSLTALSSMFCKSADVANCFSEASVRAQAVSTASSQKRTLTNCFVSDNARSGSCFTCSGRHPKVNTLSRTMIMKLLFDVSHIAKDEGPLASRKEYRHRDHVTALRRKRTPPWGGSYGCRIKPNPAPTFARLTSLDQKTTSNVISK
jgi:hypothetical protein